MTIYLVRHGLAEAGVDALDPGLAPLGRQQAAAAADALCGIRAGRLMVSPLRRTRETAEPISEALTLEPEVRDEVAEVFDPTWPAAERQAMIGPFMAGSWPDQPERLQDWRKRVLDAVLTAGLAAEASGLDLVIVSHYIAIGVAIGAAIGDNRVVPVPMANASITKMTAGHGGLSLLEAASTAHLAPEQVTGLAMIGMGKA